MKAFVDKETCIGCGICAATCPDVFEMQSDGKAGTISEKVPEQLDDEAKDSEEGCPVNAITTEE